MMRSNPRFIMMPLIMILWVTITITKPFSCSAFTTKTTTVASSARNAVKPQRRATELLAATGMDSFRNNLMTTAPLQPAQGHSQPLFGPPDKYLTAGHSIAPTATGVTAPVDSSVVPSNVPQTVMTPQVQAELDKGWKLLDSKRIGQEDFLPGFNPPDGFLSHHTGPDYGTEGIVHAQVEWSAYFLTILEKLPLIALLYVILDFVFLRPDVQDIYSEEIAQDPEGGLNPELVAETAQDTVTRIGFFFVASFLTLTFFGQ